MFKLAWRGVRNNVGRYVATLVAILTGVAFFTATGFLSDRVIDALEGDADRQYGNVDVGGRRRRRRRAAARTSPTTCASAETSPTRSPRSPEVAAVGGDLTGHGRVPRRRRQDRSPTAPPVGCGSSTTTSTRSTSTRVPRPPTPGEIAIDKGSPTTRTSPSATASPCSRSPDHTTRPIVGITSFGDTDAHDPSGTVSISAGDRVRLAELRPGRVPGSATCAAPSAQQELVDAVAPLVPDGFKVQTGDDFLRGQARRGRRRSARC